MTDQEILHIACINSYRIIIKQEDWLDIYDEEHNYFAHNPIRNVVDMEIVEKLLFYFTEIEDYDKCIEIRDYIKARTN
ncbi:MAG: hypothetical protein GY920_17400 [Aliivibrio sp.]|nr:hypothetical protein [Aliivibrio sp.]